MYHIEIYVAAEMTQVRLVERSNGYPTFYDPEDHCGSESSSGTCEPDERQKGTKHKSRIINLQGKHELAYISSIVHRLCEASRSEISAYFLRDYSLNIFKDEKQIRY